MATDAWSDAARASDPANRVATVAHAKRDLLLSVNRAKLPREELEDCFAQATLELVVRARRAPFESDAHAANALEQKFASRITDRVRAISGRSPIAAILRGAASLDVDGDEDTPVVVVDRAARVEQQALARHELRALRELARELTDDQRLVLACQVSLGMDCAQFCERYGWSAEKFRKVAQRARAKLRSLMDAHDQGDRCRALEPALLAVASRIADAEQIGRVQSHLDSCLGCARSLRDLRAAERGVAAVLPMPAAIKAGLIAKAGAAVFAIRRVLPFGSGPPNGSADAAGGGAVAGGSLLSAGAAKLGVTALCVAGAAGSYAVCSQVGVLPRADAKVGHHNRHGSPDRPASALKPTAVSVPVAVPAGRHSIGTEAPSSTRAPTARDPRRTSEFGATGGRGRAEGQGEFGGASAAAVAPTFETASTASPASREFSPSTTGGHSASGGEFGG
jgi:DNA-directed RNA polymerase specialized sigma24 family protein